MHAGSSGEVRGVERMEVVRSSSLTPFTSQIFRSCVVDGKAKQGRSWGCPAIRNRRDGVASPLHSASLTALAMAGGVITTIARHAGACCGCPPRSWRGTSPKRCVGWARPSALRPHQPRRLDRAIRIVLPPPVVARGAARRCAPPAPSLSGKRRQRSRATSRWSCSAAESPTRPPPTLARTEGAR